MAEGLIYLPLRGSNLFFFFWRQTGWMIPTATLAVPAAIISIVHLKSSNRSNPTIPMIIALFRIAGGLFVAKIALFDGAPGQEILMATTPSFIWLLVMPTNEGSSDVTPSFARVFISLLAITETLGSFPNAGTQEAIGLILPVCISVICLYDGIHWLTKRLGTGSIAWTRAIVNAAISIGVIVYAVSHESGRAENYHSFVPLDLPGSNLIHVSVDQLNHYEAAVNTIKANGDSFLTLPGMNSYYFWTGTLAADAFEC